MNNHKNGGGTGNNQGSTKKRPSVRGSFDRPGKNHGYIKHGVFENGSSGAYYRVIRRTDGKPGGKTGGNGNG